MKSSSCLAFFIAAIVAVPATADVDYNVTTCGDIAALNTLDSASTDDAVLTVNIRKDTLDCEDSYTVLTVKNNMNLTANTPVEFKNFALSVVGDSELLIKPDVTFSGVSMEDAKGGVLSVGNGTVVTFLGTANFTGNSVTLKGGAIYNKGELKFQGDATFLNNEVRQPKKCDEDDEQRVEGGAIFNAETGQVVFEGGLYMEFNKAEGLTKGFGGAIFNAGKIDAQGFSNLRVNTAAVGGAMHQSKNGETVFQGKTTFERNTGSDSVMRGSGLFNGGGLVDFKGQILFQSNGEQDNIYQDDNIDRGVIDIGRGGAIYNADDGVITFTSSSGRFGSNYARFGGAIYNSGTVNFTDTAFAYFFRNQAGEQGGAVFTRFNVDDEETTPATIIFTKNNVVFEENGAENCSDIYIEDLDGCPPDPEFEWGGWLNATAA